ncbi:MAG: Gfo/Idh/MocA family oxidoreductase [Clostridiales bacterium]|nr:Gfo/Idh/MocA family oxidoreductase [Clostridiales bacterium]
MKVKWGVIGAAGIADRRTIPGMMLAENAELVAVMEVNMELAESIRAKYDAKYAFDSEKDLLACDEVEAVYIASPVIYHFEQVRMAADAGKHILVEKPVAFSAAQAQEAVDYCAEKGVKLAAGFMMRFAAYHQEMKTLIAQGRLGDVVNASGQFTCWYPDMEGAWRQYKDQSGGGALMDMGVHLIDLLQYIMDSRIVQVAAMNDTKTFNYDVDDSSALLVRYANGAFGSINSNFNIPDEAAKWRIELYGTQGRLIGDETIGQVEAGSVDALLVAGQKDYDAAQDKQLTGQTEISVEQGNMYTKEIESLGRSILDGSPLECPAEDAVYVQKVVEAAYRSSDEKRFIDVE